jgi:hypothetical protein
VHLSEVKSSSSNNSTAFLSGSAEDGISRKRKPEHSDLSRRSARVLGSALRHFAMFSVTVLQVHRILGGSASHLNATAPLTWPKCLDK